MDYSRKGFARISPFISFQICDNETASVYSIRSAAEVPLLGPLLFSLHKIHMIKTVTLAEPNCITLYPFCTCPYYSVIHSQVPIMPPSRKPNASKTTVPKPKWITPPTMRLNAPRNQPQTNYCSPNQAVSKPMPKERLQMPTPSQPIASTRQGPTYDQLVNEINILMAANHELHREQGLSFLKIFTQDDKIKVMEETINALMAKDRPAPRTESYLHGSSRPQPAQQGPTPQTSPDAFFKDDFNFGTAEPSAEILVLQPGPPKTDMYNGLLYPYVSPFPPSLGIGNQRIKSSAPIDLTADDDIFQHNSLNRPQQPSTLPAVNATVATPSKPALLPVTDGKLVDDASVPSLSLKAAAKPAQPVDTTMADAPAQPSTPTTTTTTQHQPSGERQVPQGTESFDASIDELFNDPADLSPDLMDYVNSNMPGAAPSQESTTTLQQPSQQERQATPAPESPEARMHDGFFDFLNEEMFG